MPTHSQSQNFKAITSKNYNAETWQQIAKETCIPGIKANFIQNPLLLEFLCTTKPLKLAEGTYDRLWGIGLSLNDKDCLKPSKWVNQGILGEILEEIREVTPT